MMSWIWLFNSGFISTRTRRINDNRNTSLRRANEKQKRQSRENTCCCHIRANFLRFNSVNIVQTQFPFTWFIFPKHASYMGCIQFCFFFWRGRLRNRHFLFGVYACVIIHSWNLRATERSTFLEASVRPSGDCWGYFSYGLKGAILRQFADSPFGYIFAKGLRFALMNLETWVVEMTGSQVSFFF